MSKNRNDRKQRRRKEAEARNSLWANKSPSEQLAYLDHMGFAAIKQRKKIHKLIG